MGSSSLMIKLAFAISMFMFVSTAPYVEASISCSTVNLKLTPCLSFLTGGERVPSECCDGIKSLKSQARSKTDRQDVCKCLKSAVNSIPGLKLGNAKSLPGKCKVDIGYPVDPNIDCSKVD